MTVYAPFMPSRGTNQKVGATTSNQVITIGKDSKSIRAVNSGAVVVYFVTYKASEGARVCTSTETPLNVAGTDGATLVIEKPQDHDTIAYLSDSGTATVFFQAGEGGL